MKGPNPPRPKPCDDDGGPAHPSPPLSYATDDRGFQRDGLTKRDAFAMAALTGLCANPTNNELVRGMAHFPTFAAGWAYRMADAMLDERVAPGKPA